MRKPLVIFNFLIIYALAQLLWWGVLLIKAEPQRQAMIMGEAAVFFMIFLVGAYQLHKAMHKEHKLHIQQRNFLLSVTHELKSPLASIKLYLQTILKRDLDISQQKTFLNNSLKDIERLDDLVENMLIATKIENKSYSFPKESFDFSDLVSKITERLQVYNCSSQTIITDIEEDIMLKGDKFALTSVITNLIENAIKYSPPCADIHVKLFSNKGVAHLRVADQGIGIADEEKSRIFEKFYRVGNENTRKTKGTGLGLFIVKQVLDNHRAQIKVRNNHPTGTVFEVIFNAHGK
ncbi:MAG TPA: HAMP domain-containing sensor histidine kinase [Daejeonella sp.]|nr:HAMP domain-containing sensor histidine kinase [Daejeonella sp.]